MSIRIIRRIFKRYKAKNIKQKKNENKYFFFTRLIKQALFFKKKISIKNTFKNQIDSGGKKTE